ncbi:9251_t:CDS:2 [Entrophospora sp. SA101]|nr:9251_t:CDS:2 [Entrophospora sp. SA101]
MQFRKKIGKKTFQIVCRSTDINYFDYHEPTTTTDSSSFEDDDICYEDESYFNNDNGDDDSISTEDNIKEFQNIIDLGFPIFTKEFIEYDREKREYEQNLVNKNKATAKEIDSMRSRIRFLKSEIEDVNIESNKLEQENEKLRNILKSLKLALIYLEREISPTVCSPKIKLDPNIVVDDGSDIITYVADLRKRLNSICLLQPE